MKHLTIALLCVLAVAATAAGAQTYPEATPAASSDKSIEIKGKVISASDSSLVVQTNEGTRVTLMCDVETVKPADLKAGDLVAVSYHPLANGTNHAATVTRDTAVTTTTTTTTTTETEQTTTETMAADDDTMADDDALPQTASPFALIALIGLVALAGAAGLRIARRS